MQQLWFDLPDGLKESLILFPIGIGVSFLPGKDGTRLATSWPGHIGAGVFLCSYVALRSALRKS